MNPSTPASTPSNFSDAFQLLVIDSVPYQLLDQLLEVGVIKTEVRRSVTQASVEQFSSDGALVRIDGDGDLASLKRLRQSNPSLPIIGVACTEQDEEISLGLLGEILDDYLIETHATADRVVHAFRQARRLRMTAMRANSLAAANERLRRQATDRKLGMEVIRDLLVSQSVAGRDCVALSTDWLNELREAHTPRRRVVSLNTIVELLQQATEAEIQFEGKGELHVYADPQQLADAVSRAANAFEAATVVIKASTKVQRSVNVQLELSFLNGVAANHHLVANVLARYPKHSLFSGPPQDAAAVMQLSFAKRLVEHNLGEWSFLGGPAGEVSAAIQLTLPTRDASDVFARYCERIAVTRGPATPVTLLQVRVPSNSTSSDEMQALLSPEELAFPTSDSNWLVALTAEADQIDHRIRRLANDWNSLPSQMGAPHLPLVIRPVGRWLLPANRDEMLALIQTLCDLGDLTIATHPKLLLVRPDTGEDARHIQLDRRLQEAGYDVVNSEESQFHDLVNAHDPDAVIVACEDDAENAINRSIAETMESIAKIPVVLMSATAQSIQRGLRQGTSRLESMFGDQPAPHVSEEQRRPASEPAE